MNIEKQLYQILIDHAKHHNNGKVEGVSKPTLSNMKLGKGKTTFSKVFKALFDNGIQKAVLSGENVEMEINTITKEVNVLAKRKATYE